MEVIFKYLKLLIDNFSGGYKSVDKLFAYKERIYTFIYVFIIYINITLNTTC